MYSWHIRAPRKKAASEEVAYGQEMRTSKGPSTFLEPPTAARKDTYRGQIKATSRS